MPAILNQIVRPALSAAASGGVTSMADFRTKFQKLTGSNVGPETFKSWLTELGMVPTRQVLSIQPPLQAPSRDVQGQTFFPWHSQPSPVTGGSQPAQAALAGQPASESLSDDGPEVIDENAPDVLGGPPASNVPADRDPDARPGHVIVSPFGRIGGALTS
jgi:hypothetical protein